MHQHVLKETIVLRAACAGTGVVHVQGLLVVCVEQGVRNMTTPQCHEEADVEQYWRVRCAALMCMSGCGHTTTDSTVGRGSLCHNCPVQQTAVLYFFSVKTHHH